MSNAKKTQQKPKPINRRAEVKAPNRYQQAAKAIRAAQSRPVGPTPRVVGPNSRAAEPHSPKAGGRAKPEQPVHPDRKRPEKRNPVRRPPSGPSVNHKPMYLGTLERKYTYPDGAVSETRVHTSKASYMKTKSLTERKAALAEGTVWKSEPGQEFREIRSDGEHLRMCGREFLAQVEIENFTLFTTRLGSVGERVLVRPLSPESIGGRIKRIAELYESHKALKFQITYSPVVPATTPGALAMAYIADVATPQLLVGVGEMVHLSTACDFVEFPVWETCVLDIDPDRFTREVADEQEGDARFTTDGLLVVLLAGPIVYGTGKSIFGNLFLTYEYDFSTPLLDMNVAAPISGTVTVQASAATTTLQGSAYAAKSNVPGAHPLWTVFGLTVAASADFLMTLTLQSIEVTTSLPVLRIFDSDTTFDFNVGQAYFCRVAESTTPGDFFLFFFDSMDAASQFVYDQAALNGALTSGQVLSENATGAGTNQYRLEFTMTALDVSINAVV